MKRVAAVCVYVVVGLAAANVARAARLTVSASKPETLNAGRGNADCSALSKTPDAELPLHIVRLEVALPANATGPVRYEWSLPNPSFGKLVADEDIPNGEQALVVHALCAEIGNKCELTADQLTVYQQPTILWVAPTCDEALPADPLKPYRGGRVSIGVRAFAGKKKLGKGTVSIGYGRTAAATLTVNGKTGLNTPVRSGIQADFVSTVDPMGVTLPPIDSHDFDNGDGDSGSAPGPSLQGEAVLEYSTGGKHVGTLTVNLHDGSALCDNIAVDVLTSDNRIKLDVKTNPPPGTFRPGDSRSGTVALHVRVTNTSDPNVARGVVLFEGASVLTCDTEVRVGDSKLTKTTSIDFQHCSVTLDQSCTSDGDCSQKSCPECQPGEVCLASSHCSFNGSGFDVRGCVRDADCGPGGQCVLVLPVTSLTLGIGQSAELLTSMVPVANILPGTAKVTDTWTVRARNAPDDSEVVKYSITSNPAVTP